MTDVDRKTKNIVVRCLRPYKGYGLPREGKDAFILLCQTYAKVLFSEEVGQGSDQNAVVA